MSNQYPGRGNVQQHREVPGPSDDSGRFAPSGLPGIERGLPSRAHFALAQQGYSQIWRPGTFQAMGPGAGAPVVTMRWPIAGQVIGMMLQTDVMTPESLASVGLKLTIGPNQLSLFMNGVSGSPDFMKLATIIGINPQPYPSPLNIPVCRNDTWTFETFNFNATNTYTFDCGLWFRDC